MNRQRRKKSEKARITALCVLLLLTLFLPACKDPGSRTEPGSSYETVGSEKAKPTEESTENTAIVDDPVLSSTESESEGSDASVTTVPSSTPPTSQPTGTEPVSESDPPLNEIRFCTAEALNVREGPSTDSEKLGAFYYGEEVRVQRDRPDGWSEVLYYGRTCYVRSEYLSPDRPPEPETEPHGDEPAATPGAVEYLSFDPSWEFAEESRIHSGQAVLYRASGNRNGIVVGVNAGHGTAGGSSQKTYCHPDHTPKLTGGSTSAGSLQATAVSSGMTFRDGTPEASVTLRAARILRDLLLSKGYDVLMIRDAEDVQLDNIARTVFCNERADCHIALHWDGDELSYDKGCFYMSVPDGLRSMYPVSIAWQKSESLGDNLIRGLRSKDLRIFETGSMDVDLTQTSYSKVASVDIELGNETSAHDDDTLQRIAEGLASGIDSYFGL